MVVVQERSVHLKIEIMRLTERQKRIVDEIERIRGAAYNYDKEM
jgi:hypothetical protein